MEKRIFISHSSKDAQTATVICDALEKNGMKCWIAPRDIPYGKEWAGEISKAISNSSAFLFLSSGNSNASGQVSREIQLAIENQVPIIPIRLDGSEYSDTNKYYLATIHCMFQYDASKVAKLVADITKEIPVVNPPLSDSEAPAVKKEKKERKPHHGLRMALSTLWLWLCAVAAAYLVVFSGLGTVVAIIAAVAALVAGLIPLFILRSKAVKSFTINKTTVNGILALGLIGVIGIGAASFVLDNHLWYSDMEYKHHIVLTAPDSMKPEEFEAAYETVKERMDIIADGQRYTIELKDDEIELIIPFEIFGELTATDMLKCYVSRAARLYLTTNAYEAPDPAQVEVTPTDIESAKILKGKIPGEPEVSEEDVLDTENYEYIEVVLKKEFVEANREAIAAFGDEIVFAQDKVEIGSGYYYFYTYKSDDECVYYILNNDRHPTLNEVLINNMTSEPLSDSLLARIDLSADWEKEKEGAVFGANQVEYKKIKGETVSISYRASTYGDISEGSWHDTVAAFKKRLDALGEPYAFGYGINDPYLIVVKMSPDKLSSGILYALCSSGISFNAGYTQAYVPTYYTGENKCVKLTEVDGVPALEIIAQDSSDLVLFENLCKAAELENKEYMFLIDRNNASPLLRAKATAGDSLIFTCLEGEEEKSTWIPALALAIYETKLDSYLTLESCIFSDKNRTFNDVFLDEEIRRTIEETYAVSFIEEVGGNLRISIELPVDENLPQNMISTAKKLYELVDFENSFFDDLSLYFIKEQGEERARVFFRKDYAQMYYGDELVTGYIYAHGIFEGGRIEKDHQVFLDLIAEDEFFQRYNKTAEGNLFFE